MGDFLSQSTPELMDIVSKYAQLAAISNSSFTEADVNQLEEILTMALDNELLSLWIAEVDHILGHHLSFLDEGARQSYKNQQALLRDYAGTARFPRPANEQIGDYLCLERPEFYDTNDLR